MTKRELIAALEPFDDGQEVFVNLFSRDEPNGSQVIIQGVRSAPPWHNGPDLVGLVAHDRNAFMATLGDRRLQARQTTVEFPEPAS